jgi:hypothetical protein
MCAASWKKLEIESCPGCPGIEERALVAVRARLLEGLERKSWIEACRKVVGGICWAQTGGVTCIGEGSRREGEAPGVEKGRFPWKGVRGLRAEEEGALRDDAGDSVAAKLPPGAGGACTRRRGARGPSLLLATDQSRTEASSEHEATWKKSLGHQATSQTSPVCPSKA